MMTSVEVFYKVVLARVRNEKGNLKIENFIETIHNIETMKE